MKSHHIFPLIAALAGMAVAQDAAAPAAAPAKPAAAKPEAAAAAKKPGDLITVTSEGGAEINQNKNLMVYIQDVKFLHPAQNLEMTCERLEVFRDPPPPPKPKPALEAEAAGAAVEQDAPQPELREAIATVNVVIKKKGADGKISTGKGQKAIFLAKTELIILSGSPQPSLDIGSDYLFYADTITLKQNGEHTLGKNARTVFKKQKEGGAGGGKDR